MFAKDGYNFIYEELVKAPDDVLGIIAYAYYKQQKIEFIQDFQRQHNRNPRDEELAVFYVTANSEASLSSYRTKAEEVVRQFLDTTLSALRENDRINYEAALNKEVEKFKPMGFWSGVAQNAFASILVVILSGAVLFWGWSSKFGMRHLLEQVFDVEITQKSIPDASDGSPPAIQ